MFVELLYAYLDLVQLLTLVLSDLIAKTADCWVLVTVWLYSPWREPLKLLSVLDDFCRKKNTAEMFLNFNKYFTLYFYCLKIN